MLTSNEYKYEDYPDTLRLIRIKDKKKDTYIDVLTNNFKLSAAKIAELYKGRWEVEEFFKWIKPVYRYLYSLRGYTTGRSCQRLQRAT